MSTPPSGRAAPNPLARVRFVLAPNGVRRPWIGSGLLVAAALLAGAAAGHFYGPGLAGPWQGEPDRAQPPAMQELPVLRQALEQARLQLRVAEAHGQELERQIDALNQRLRACDEELSFFRKARDTRR